MPDLKKLGRLQLMGCMYLNSAPVTPHKRMGYLKQYNPYLLISVCNFKTQHPKLPIPTNP
jgi:hypothetical protein